MTAGTVSFGERSRAAIGRWGHLCVGIDPHASLLEAWGLADDASGTRELGLRVVESAAGNAGFVKPQVAFFERHGSRGVAALEDVVAAAREAGLLVIADAKRGDIGSSMDAYAAAWLTPGSPLEVDALTVSPYLGVGALSGTFALARAHGKGAFVLAATSNPEAVTLQSSVRDGRTLPAQVIREVTEHNRREAGGSDAWGSIGFVIGATVDRDAAGLEPYDTPAPILAPGFGHQGAAPADLAAIYGPYAATVVANEGRSVLAGGPSGLAERIAAAAAAYPTPGAEHEEAHDG